MPNPETITRKTWTWHGVVHEFNRGVTQGTAQAYARERAYWLRHHARRRILLLLKGKLTLTMFLLSAIPAHAQVTRYQQPPPPAWAHQTPPPGSQPNMLISPPPASWQGQWRPEYGQMIAPPWTGAKR